MMNPYMQETEKALVHTYNRFPVILKRERASTFTIPRERNIWICGRDSSLRPGVRQSGTDGSC